MKQRSASTEVQATDLATLASLVRNELSSEVPEEFIDPVIAEAQVGNGPAEYILASWWEKLAFHTNARHWYSLSASHNHAPALKKLRATPSSENDRKLPKRRIAS